jgi:hypothetical protein
VGDPSGRDQRVGQKHVGDAHVDSLLSVFAPQVSFRFSHEEFIARVFISGTSNTLASVNDGEC